MILVLGRQRQAHLHEPEASPVYKEDHASKSQNKRQRKETKTQKCETKRHRALLRRKHALGDNACSIRTWLLKLERKLSKC